MADWKGAEWSPGILASAGIYRTVTIEDTAGVPRDLTGKSIVVVVKDDKEHAAEYGSQFAYEETIAQTITSAVNGQFIFAIPPASFRNTEGGRLSYEMYEQDSSGNRVPVLWGYLDVQERG